MKPPPSKNYLWKLVEPGDITAVQWCAAGAIIKCYTKYELPYSILNRHINKSVTEWNDSSTFAEVRRMLKRLDI